MLPPFSVGGRMNRPTTALWEHPRQYPSRYEYTMIFNSTERDWNEVKELSPEYLLRSYIMVCRGVCVSRHFLLKDWTWPAISELAIGLTKHHIYLVLRCKECGGVRDSRQVNELNDILGFEAPKLDHSAFDDLLEGL